MKLVLALAAIVGAFASQTEYVDLAMEIAAPPGESNDQVNELIQESAGSMEAEDDVVYRISWNTQYDSTPSNTASKGTFKITIKGVGGDTTGEKTLVTHPGYACGAASDPECFPDIKGKVKADDDASAKCACDPSKSDYSEVDAKWAPVPGKVQHFYLKAKDVGEIAEVKITSDAAASDSWTPGFLKINMNDMETGVGNGIYYMDIGKKINKDAPMEKKASATDSDGEKLKMEKRASHKYGIIKCEASACEKEMEKMMTFAAKAK